MTQHEAAERLVDSFSAIPTEWVKIVAEKTGSEFYGIMWDTMFLVNDPVDKRRIQALSLNLSGFVARKHWPRSRSTPCHFRAHHVPKGAHLGDRLAPMATHFHLLQIRHYRG
jgi:hypothetical protein